MENRIKSCPACGSALSEGVVTLKGLTPQFFMPIFSDQDLWFVRKNGKKKIVPSEEQRQAFLCDSCGTVCIMPPAPWTPPDLSGVGEKIVSRLAQRRNKQASKQP